MSRLFPAPADIQALVAATEAGDTDMLDCITRATFAYDAGALAPAIREIRDDYMRVARERLEALPVSCVPATRYPSPRSSGPHR